MDFRQRSNASRQRPDDELAHQRAAELSGPIQISSERCNLARRHRERHCDRRARIFRKQSDITNPPPANLWVILDESPGTINDGLFVCDPFGFPNTWVDLPAAYHAGGCGISFADGHSLIHPWSDPVVLGASGTEFVLAQQNPPTDLRWLQTRSTSHR